MLNLTVDNFSASISELQNYWSTVLSFGRLFLFNILSLDIQCNLHVAIYVFCVQSICFLFFCQSIAFSRDECVSARAYAWFVMIIVRVRCNWSENDDFFFLNEIPSLLSAIDCCCRVTFFPLKNVFIISFFLCVLCAFGDKFVNKFVCSDFQIILLLCFFVSVIFICRNNNKSHSNRATHKK